MNIINEAYLKGYRVTSEGVPLSKRGCIKPRIGTNGYMFISVRFSSNVKKIEIHRLQAFQKYGEKLFEKGVQTRHLNGDRLDNSWDNIAIGTQSENMMDIPKHIRVAKALFASSKLRKYNKLEVIEYYNTTKSYSKTMIKFNISSKGTLHYILKG